MPNIYKEDTGRIYKSPLKRETKPDNIAIPEASYFTFASQTNSPNILEYAANAAEQLMSGDSTAVMRDTVGNAREEFSKAKNDVIIDLAKMEGPTDQRQQAIEDVAQAEYEPDVISEIAVNQGSQYDPIDGDGDEVVSRRADEVFFNGVANMMLKNAEVRQAIQDLQADVGDFLTDSTPEAIAEAGEGIFLPFVTGDIYSGVAEDLFPEESNRLASFALPGEAQEFLSNKFSAMSGDELRDMLPELEESIKERSGILSDNGFMAQIMISEVFAEELGLRGRDDFNWDRLWNNVAGIADLTVIAAPLSRLGFSLNKSRSMNKLIQEIERTNPEAARDLHASILASENKAAEAVSGMSAEDSITSVYPSFRGAVNSNTPGGVVEKISNLNTELRKIEEDLAFGINYTQEELTKMQQRVTDAYNKMDGSFRQSFSEFQIDVDEGKGFTIKAAIGPSDDTGFKSFDDAIEHFQDNFPEGTNVDFMVREGDTVVQRSADDIADDAEVWYRVEAKYDYNVSLMDESELLFGGPTTDKAFSILNPIKNSFAFDPASKFSRFTAKAASRAQDLGQGIQGRMNDAFKQGVLKLPRQSQVKVIDAIQEGSRRERNFTADDLIGMGLNSDEVNGYMTVRGLMDLEWSLNNRRVYNTLSRDGYESVVNYDRGFEAFGKTLSSTSDQLKFSNGRIGVFDPDTNQIVKLSRQEVDELYESGGQILKSRTPVQGGNGSVTFIASGLGDGTRVRPLTLNPLSYREGYVTRFYDENYFVKLKSNRIVDGVKTERLETVAAAPTNRDAERLIKTLQEQNPGNEFVKVLDRNLSDSQKIDDEFDYLHHTGGIITGRRGEQLKGVTDAQAKTIDPVQSIMDSISYTSRRVSHDDVIAGFERRWVNQWGRKFGLDSIPDDLRTIRGGTATEAGVDEARSHAAYIQAMRGTQGDAAQAWRASMIRIAEHVDNAFNGGRISKSLTDPIRKFNPMKTLRGLNFNFLLAAAPTRQLVLQANQISFLTGMAPRYMVSGQMARDFTAFSVAAATRNRPMWGQAKPKLAKLIGMKPDDFEKMYDGYVRSGLPFSIDSHTFARDGLQDLSRRISGNLAERTARRAGNIVKAPMLLAKRVGFDAGEWSNLTMTWLVAFNDWRKKNPGRNWRTKAAMDDVSTEARDLALNMTRSGELPYQRGALSLATQFLSYQHKALLALTGANKAFSNLSKQQRIGMIAAQSVLYGADGLGIGSFVDKARDQLGLDVPERALPVLEGLGYEFVINSLLSEMTDENVDINFSGNFAPGSGVLSSFSDLMGNLMTMDVPSVLLGPTSSVLGRIGDAVQTIKVIKEIPDLTQSEQLEAVLQQGGSLFGGYNSYVKGQAMRKLGWAVASNGQPMYKTAYAEGLFQSLFGTSPNAEEDYWRIVEGMNGPFTQDSVISKIGGPSENDIDEVAEHYYDRVLEVFRGLEMGDIESRDELWQNQMRAKVALENTVMAVLPEDVQYAVRKRIHDRIDRNINTSGTDDLIQTIGRAVIGGTEALSTREYYVRMLKNADFKYTDQQMRDINLMIDYMTEED